MLHLLRNFFKPSLNSKHALEVLISSEYSYYTTIITNNNISAIQCIFNWITVNLKVEAMKFVPLFPFFHTNFDTYFWSCCFLDDSVLPSDGKPLIGENIILASVCSLNNLIEPPLLFQINTTSHVCLYRYLIFWDTILPLIFPSL